MTPEPKGKGNETAEAGAGNKKQRESDAKKKVQNAITVKSLAPKMLANKPEAAADGAEEAAREELEKSWIAGFKHGRYGYTTIWLFGSLAPWPFGDSTLWLFRAMARRL